VGEPDGRNRYIVGERTVAGADNRVGVATDMLDNRANILFSIV